MPVCSATNGNGSTYGPSRSGIGGQRVGSHATRLKSMEAHDLIVGRIYSEHPPRLEYHLTEKGKSLGPVLKALRDWGERHS